MQGLSERHAEQEQQQREPDADPPPGQFLPAAPAAAFLALDRRESRHGE